MDTPTAASRVRRCAYRFCGFFVANAVAIILAACSSSSSLSSSGPPATKCQISVAPTTQGVPAAGGAVHLDLSAQPECAWTATADASWISAVTPDSGQGSAQLSAVIAPNEVTSVRRGNVSIGDTTVVLTQEGAPCVFTLTPLSQAIPMAGGSFAVSVAAASGCAWTALSDNSWIQLAGGTSGNGDGSFSVNVLANSGTGRAGSIRVAGATITVAQEALQLPCVSTVTPATASFASSGGDGALTIQTTATCSWIASSDAPWITIATPSRTGSGNATVSYSVAANTGAARSGTLQVAGQAVTVTQAAAAACAFSLDTATQSVPASGGAGSVTLTTAAGCQWSAATDVPWITISGQSQNRAGPGVVSFVAAANAGPARTGTVTIASQKVTVTQAAATLPCTYTLGGSSQTIAAAGGTGAAVSLTTDASCTWTVSTSATWITLTSAATNTGSGQVAFTAAANTGGPRGGTITIAGQAYTVNQDGAGVTVQCSYSINPASQTATAAAASGLTVAMTAATGCAWTAASNASWITVTAGATGSGNGTVTFAVTGNSGASRSGTLTIGGQTATIMQDAVAAAPCTYTLNPPSQSVNATATTGLTVAVTTASSCAWTATSNAPWITISGGTGPGNGTVTFAVAANPGVARSGTIAVGNQTAIVNQPQAPCSYSINPTTASFNENAASSGPVTVTAGSGCGWTAVSNAPWITVVTGASGTSLGTVTFSVAANTGGAPGSSRQGSLTIANNTLTVTQSGPPCNFSLNPAARTVNRGSGTGSISVTTTAACQWTAMSTAGWISITSTPTMTGSGSFNYSFTQNSSGIDRIATITVGGSTFTLTQRN